MPELILKTEAYAIAGAAIEVHKELGHGFLEAVYHEALEIELLERRIPFESRKPLKIQYKSKALQKEYVADFVCYGQIVVEIKALPHLSGNETAQVLNYLKATGLKLGLLFNFGSEGRIEWKRLVR